jgi:uncharacterized protein HemX
MNGELARWAGIIVGVISALVGLIFLLVRQRADKQDLRADKQDEKIAEGQRALASHIEANVRTHAEHGERLAKLEAHTSTHDAEIRKLRDMRHDINHETAKLILEYYNSTMERINELKDRILGRSK